MTQNTTLNNTLEEALRIEVCDQLKTINALKAEVDMLKRMVVEEQDQKYRAYVKISDLQKYINSKEI